MGMEVGESYIKRTLKSLCLSYGWSYGVFWRLDPNNHMLLTMEDAYYEGHVVNLKDIMLVQVHMLGEGIIGEAAIHGKYKWFLNPLEDSQFHIQISSGIKTIAVIPIELQGVVQFGSTNEISETVEFLDQARNFLQNHNNFEGLTPAGIHSDQNVLLTPVIPTQNSLCNDVSRSLANNLDGCSLIDSLHFSKDLDELFQWLDDASKICSGLDLEAILSDDNLSDPSRITNFSGIHGTQPACSSQSSLTALNSCKEAKALVNGANYNESVKGSSFSECISDNNEWVKGSSFSECISEARGHSFTLPKELLSELGLNHLLKGISGYSCIDDQFPSMKKRKIESSEIVNDQFHQKYDPWGVRVMQNTSTGVQTQDFWSFKESIEKAQESLRMDAMSCVSGVDAQSRKNEKPLKGAKKRARPGESTRRRPKDRQLISERIKDLRELIPNGAKLSIDALLGRTIKHMLFLQNLNKHAGKFKQVNEPKLISQDDSLIEKGGSISSGGNGRRNATWAYEIGGSNLLCPIIVEDLDEPGQMLIEMLCEERGYFLKIADIVRGLGLTILKGVIEAKNDKLWAHFIVEGNKHITRMDVFVSLMQLLQSTNTTSQVQNTICEPLNIVTGATPLWVDFQQHAVPLPI